MSPGNKSSGIGKQAIVCQPLLFSGKKLQQFMYKKIPVPNSRT